VTALLTAYGGMLVLVGVMCSAAVIGRVMDVMRRVEQRHERAILFGLQAHPECLGLELVERSGGALKRGTVYVHLARLEAQGLVASEYERYSDDPMTVVILRMARGAGIDLDTSHLPRRRRYRLTAAGQLAVASAASGPNARVWS
jgi:DNA-binding transcriptional ArsR family regulator